MLTQAPRPVDPVRLIRLREQLHRWPELGLHTPRTQQAVLDALSGLPLEVTTGAACSSVVAVVRGRAPRHDPSRSVLLRADLDAVPVQESTGLPYASQVAGAMHACGHDLHAAMLVGAAHALCAARQELAGDVVLMFQPGEEGFEGARTMIAEGVLDASGARVRAALALHVFSAVHPSGVFFARPGPMMASSTSLDVVVRGRGGHGSAPHLARDPIVAAAEMITSLYAATARRVDALDPVVLNVGVVAAGTGRNVVPEQACFEATLRAFSHGAARAAGERLTAVLRGVAAAHEVEVDVALAPRRPVTLNDPGELAGVRGVVVDRFGADRFVEPPRPMTATEDFSRVLAQVPGVFLGLGATPPGVDPATAAYNHGPDAVFDGAVVPDGADLLSRWAIARLAAPTPHEERA